MVTLCVWFCIFSWRNDMVSAEKDEIKQPSDESIRYPSNSLSFFPSTTPSASNSPSHPSHPSLSSSTSPSSFTDLISHTSDTRLQTKGKIMHFNQICLNY